MIARCRQDLFYSSCDTLDTEVAREGVEYEDEMEFAHKPLVDYRLGKIQAMSLHDKHAITTYLCHLGYKVTHCGDNFGKERQLECPLLIDFDVGAPVVPVARRYKWKMFKTTDHLTITSLATKQYIKSLRALSVVTNAKVFEKFDRLITIIRKRQTFIEYVTSNMYCLWALELLTHCNPILSRTKGWCVHVDQHLVASAGIGMDTARSTAVNDRGTDSINSQNEQGGSVGKDSNNQQEGDEDDDADNTFRDNFYGDPLFFSRIGKLVQMDAKSKREAIFFLRQFSGGLQLYQREQRVVRGQQQQQQQQQEEEEEYLFSVRNTAT